MELREASLTIQASPLDAGLHMMMIRVPIQVRQRHKEKVDFPFFSDRTGNLIPHEWHRNHHTHIRGQSRVINYGPLQSGRIRHRPRGAASEAILLLLILQLFSCIDTPVEPQKRLHTSEVPPRRELKL